MTRLGGTSKLTQQSTDDLLNAWTLSQTQDHLSALPEGKKVRGSRGGVGGRFSRIIAHPAAPAGRPNESPRMASPPAPDTMLFEAFGTCSLREEPDAMPMTAHVEARPVSAQRLLESRLPRSGDVFSGFRIIRELGRGAFARVFLAEEVNLGSRLVAIKVSESEGDEPRILARLQHTHIVPIHSVHVDATTGLRVLCMPYVGGANLAQVLETVNADFGPALKRRGDSLIRALDRVSRAYPSLPNESSSPLNAGSADPTPSNAKSSHSNKQKLVSSRKLAAKSSRSASRSWRVFRRSETPRPESLEESSVGSVAGVNDDQQPARRFLRGATSIEAAVWIIARLAEGLEHAHSRGLLHRDIKPSNILVAADGTPMLLDFNLSVDTTPEDESKLDRAMIGGTLPYMAPEHLDAFNPQGGTAPEEVDARSDIYALGLIFHELVTGEPAFPSPPDNYSILETIRFMREARRQPPSLRAANPAVPWSLDALAARCLNPDASQRYARAGDLADDLRRFLDNLPMKHCPDPSPKERIRKWARRHPALSSSTSVGLFSLVFMLILVGSVALLHSHIQKVASRLNLQVFQQRFVEAQFWLNTQSDRPDHLKRGLDLSLQCLEQLGLSGSNLRLKGRWIDRLPEIEREHVQEQALELCLLVARAEVKLAEQKGNEEDRRLALERAITILDAAESTLPRSTPALLNERARFLEALGQSDRAAEDRQRAQATPPSSSYDYLLLGMSNLADGKINNAEKFLKEATKRDATSFWAWFSLGHSYFEQRRYADAVAAFTGAVARGPEFAWAHFNLGLALARAGRLSDAQTSYDKAIKIDPRFAEAIVNRGLVELELNQLTAARDDFEKAIAEGRGEASVLTALGETLSRLGRSEEATQMFDRILAQSPENVNVLVARGMTRLDKEPALAREDFENALKADPEFAAAQYGIARLIRVQDSEQALARLAKAIDSDPNLIEAIELRALIRARAGDPSTLTDVERLSQNPSPHRLYNAACALTVYANRSRDARWLTSSVELLSRAIDLGFPKGEVEHDPDLAVLHSRADFQRLLMSHSDAQ